MRVFFRLFFAVIALIVHAEVLAAQGYPIKPIRMIVPSSPGTSSDFLARLVAQKLTDTYKQQVVVDNRAGAGGLIASSIISKENPDGYTIGMFGLTWVISALVHKNPPYHPIRDATAISGISSIPNAVVVAPSIPARSVQEFIQLAKSRPGQLNFASVGVGSSSHIAAEIFVHAAGIKAVHVPFKTLSSVFSEMTSGQIHFYVFTVPSTLAMLGERKFRALAVTSKMRSAALPDVPTVAEAGLPAAEFDNWSGLIAPAKMPRKLVQKINADVREILQNPDMVSLLAARGAVPSEYTTSESFAALLKSEYERYKTLIPEIGIVPN